MNIGYLDNLSHKFTTDMGVETSFIDRQEAQDELQQLVDQMPMNDKDKIDFEQFK